MEVRGIAGSPGGGAADRGWVATDLHGSTWIRWVFWDPLPRLRVARVALSVRIRVNPWPGAASIALWR